MSALNARAEIDRVDFADVAREFLDAQAGGRAPRACGRRCSPPDFARLTATAHGPGVRLARSPRSRSGIPLGIAAARGRRLAQPVLRADGNRADASPRWRCSPSSSRSPADRRVSRRSSRSSSTRCCRSCATRTRGCWRCRAASATRAARSGLTDRTILATIELPLAAPTIARRREDRGGDRRGHGDDRGVRRRGRLRRAHRAGPRAERPPGAARGRAAGRGASRCWCTPRSSWWKPGCGACTAPPRVERSL